MPAISRDRCTAAVHLAGDGYLDPHGATHAVADAARALGVRIRTGVRVTGFELSARREVTARPDRSRPDRHRARRQRGRDLGAAGGGDGRRVHPVDAGRSPAHRAARPCRARAAAETCPASAIPTTSSTARAEHGGMVFGGYETDPVSRWEDGVPWEHAARSLPPDYERFAPLMAGAIRRFPFLADAEAIRLVCHPDAMTPDANPLLGPDARRARLLGGRRPVAQRLRRWRRDRPGAGRLDHRRRPRRRHRPVPRLAVRRRLPRSRGSARVWRARRTADYYRLRYPYDADVAGRPRRLSAAARAAPGGRRCLRDQGGLGAGRPLRAGRDRGAGPGAIRPPMAGLGPRGSTGWSRRPGRFASGPASST